MLLWTYWNAQNTTRAWLFDPQQADDLIEIGAALPSNIFCAGHSFTRRRGLAIVGGFPFGHPDQNRKTYLFNPLTLQPTVPSGTPPFLIAPGTPSTWIETPEMRYCQELWMEILERSRGDLDAVLESDSSDDVSEVFVAV
ncbi:hypothetical protein [Engelhardtia mirabilis]|uniref:Uncharacterized protein n=1 Tax=Engelhardtia mirabilis TaxID=2528011 RepID=A0A518BK58_9BACT|nr:hypothetical protein Pla133_24420 [Planctomycetes bacterium Pla133]QDV01686.1 hypothetical protein Pla86_24410 [Planctomycetes bacterium Pla86]